ncbi:MAG: ATP synthase F1 subunit delta [Verrucomicrobiota bacterium]
MKPSSKAARRYARAVFDLAHQSDRLDPVYDDMKSVRALASESPEFAGFINNPLIPVEKRQTVLKALFSKKLETIALQFLYLLNEKGRLGLLDEVCDHLETLVLDLKKRLKIHVVSARPLEKEQLATIKKKMSKRFGREIEADVSDDPALLGGFKIHVGDQVFDSSLAHRLELFKQQLIKA